MNLASRIVAPDADLIGKVAARIDSPHDGEVLSAARLTVARLDRLGLKIGDVVRQGVVSCQMPIAPAYKPDPIRPIREHQRQAMEVRASGIALSDWEGRFLRTLWELRNEPSPKQKAILDDLVRRAREARG